MKSMELTSGSTEWELNGGADKLNLRELAIWCAVIYLMMTSPTTLPVQITFFSSHRLEGWGKSESRCSGYKKIVNDCLNDDAEIIQLDFVDLTTEKEISVALASQSIESSTTRNLLISFTVIILLTTFVLIVWKRETVKDFWGRNIQSDQIKLWENNAAEVL